MGGDSLDARTTQPARPVAAPQEVLEPDLLHRMFLGDDGLCAGWGIVLFVFICVGLYYAVSHLHLLPSQPQPTSARTSPELAPVSSIISEGLILLLASVATLTLSRIEGRSIGVYGLGGFNRLRLFMYGLLWGFISLSALVLVL
jgi:hypothetical protein